MSHKLVKITKNLESSTGSSKEARRVSEASRPRANDELGKLHLCSGRIADLIRKVRQKIAAVTYGGEATVSRKRK